MKDYTYTELTFIETSAERLRQAACSANAYASSGSADARQIAMRNMAASIFVLSAFIEAEENNYVASFSDPHELGFSAVEEIQRIARVINLSAKALSRSGNSELVDHHRRQLFAALFALAPFGPKWKLRPCSAPVETQSA